jgi:nitrogen fixation protein NifB
MEKDFSNHPCFNKEAKHKYARVHLPVAPKCNIQCNYCDRQYDCVNESRPGVTSAVLKPLQAVEYIKAIDGKIDNLAVVGIAGPGDPFANPKETMATLREVSKNFPEKILCLSSNGLQIEPYIDELAEMNVAHVTITINGIDPEILAKIYSWVRIDNKIYRGVDGATRLLNRQLSAIKKLKEKGIVVKINTIVLPGINDKHIEELAQYMSELGADLMNCIPVYPNKDTKFENIEKPSTEMMKEIREKISKYIKPMTHCARCRADAAGILGEDNQEAMYLLQEIAAKPIYDQERPYVAVATYEGIFVNQHLGEARELYIFRETPNGFHLVEQRPTPIPGSGEVRWLELARKLQDCRAILVSGVGPNPEEILNNTGVQVIQMTGHIDEGLEGVYQGKPIRSVSKSELFKCGGSCKGNSKGCA